MRNTTTKRLNAGGLLLTVLGVLGAMCFAEKMALAVDLYTTTGTASLPGGSVPVWGYSFTSGGTTTSPGGPTIAVNQGDLVTVIRELFQSLEFFDLPEETGSIRQANQSRHLRSGR